MDMSAAALPAVSGFASKADENHPLYKEWRKAEQFCRNQMINGQSFKNWLYQRESAEYRQAWTEHAEYKNFMTWMRENKGGARPCPNGQFPENFKFWLDGGRW